MYSSDVTYHSIGDKQCHRVNVENLYVVNCVILYIVYFYVLYLHKENALHSPILKTFIYYNNRWKENRYQKWPLPWPTNKTFLTCLTKLSMMR